MNLFYLSSLGGGLDTNIHVLAPALVQAGHRVSVLYIHLPGESDSAPQRLDGCDVYHATIGNWHYYFRRATLGKTHLPALVRALEYTRALGQSVAKIAKEKHLDLAEVPEVLATPRLLHAIPCVLRLHSSAWMCRRMYGEESPWTDTVEAKLEGIALRRAHGISSPSRAVAEYIRSACHLGTRRIEIIPYPIDTSQFVPGKARANPPVVLFVGRVEMRKGADVLIRAMPRVWEKYPACELVFIGYVSAPLKDRVERVDARVRFLGVRPREELVAWYQRASVFAAPSMWDNSPNTIYEAMACGAPVIASRVGGIPELVDDGVNGWLVPPRDENTLADAMIALLDDPAQREKMGRRARDKAEVEFSVEKILGQTLDFYHRALGSRG